MKRGAATSTGSTTAASQPQDGPAKLREAQWLLVRCLARLFNYACERGYELTLGEGYVQPERKLRDGTFAQDGVHMPASLHYVRLAQDLNLFVKGVYITDGGSFAWIDLGHFWEALDPAASWGGRFKSGDANHFSITFGGKQ